MKKKTRFPYESLHSMDDGIHSRLYANLTIYSLFFLVLNKYAQSSFPLFTDFIHFVGKFSSLDLNSSDVIRCYINKCITK